MHADPVPWLLESHPWTRYRTMTDLLDLPGSDPEPAEAKADLSQHELTRKLAE